MSEYMSEHVREWKVEKCELCTGIVADVLTVTASLRLDRECMADHRRDVEIFMESLVKGPATVLSSSAVNKLLDETIELREKLDDAQDRLDEIRDAVKVLRNLEGERMTEPTNTLPEPYQSGMLKPKPCPFCHGEVELRPKLDGYDETYFFHCKKCHMWFEKFDYRGMDEKQIVKEWNRRADE